MSESTEGQAAAGKELEATAREYLGAFEGKDLARCVSLFAEDAVIDFQGSRFDGAQAIEDWHKERFSANLKVNRVETLEQQGDSVVADVVVSSDRLAAWNVKTLKGRITLYFEGGKVKQMKLAARMTNIFDILRMGE
jgi:ketosteroid isomerase-like protein